MNEAAQFRRAAAIERQLRAEGVDSELIPGIIGAAFMASLTNLRPAARRRVLAAHVRALDAVIADVLKARQAPGGPMPDLGKVN